MASSLSTLSAEGKAGRQEGQERVAKATRKSGNLLWLLDGSASWESRGSGHYSVSN